MADHTKTLTETLSIYEKLGSSQKYEYYDTGDDGNGIVHGNEWFAQTFTPLTDHYITSVKLKSWRDGLPGDVIVSIKATDGSNHPTGNDLTSTTFDANDLPTSFGAAIWKEITLPVYLLLASIKYALVVRAPDGDTSNTFRWRLDTDGSGGNYSGGCEEYSSSGGSSWTSYTDRDLLFEEWGKVSVGPLSSLNKALLESMSVSESSASQAAFKFASTDLLAFTESLVHIFGLKKNEAVAFVESLSESVERQVSFSDIFTLTESQKVQVSKKFTETMSISEGHTYEMPTVIRHILHIGP